MYVWILNQGQNLILNMNDHNVVVCAFNRTIEKVNDFLADEAKGKGGRYPSLFPSLPFPLKASILME